MIEVWRLARRTFCPTPAAAFNGHGAAVAGGRWNRKGARAAYASSSRSLAVLEILATIDRANAPDDYVFAGAELDERDVVHVARLPLDWRTPGYLDMTRNTGMAFITEKTALALAVPSVIVPKELNYLVNPLHPRFPLLAISSDLEDFAFDARLFNQRTP